MNNKLFSIIVLGIIAVIGVILVLIVRGSAVVPSPEDLVPCHNLIYSSDSAINLVFFGSREEAKKYSGFLQNTVPFNEYKNAFNVYYITNYVPECEIYKGIALFCHSRDLVKKAASCPNDYIVVLKKDGQSIRSSSYLNVLSINLAHPLSVFQHEFGHAFGNFAEEYFPARLPLGAPNCKASCDEFGDNINECKEGCSKTNYIRSIDNGVMRTLYSDKYGLFDEEILRGRMNDENIKSSMDDENIKSNVGVSGNVISNVYTCIDKNYILLEIDGNKVIKEVHKGCPGGGYGASSYSSVGSDGKILDEQKFNPNNIYTIGVSGEEDREIFKRDVPFTITSKISKGASEIKLNVPNAPSVIGLSDLGVRACKI